MLDNDPNLKPQYRMPRVFGALPGPRNVPKDKQHLPNRQTNLALSVTALTDADLLSQLLPPNCSLQAAPLITMGVTYMNNIGWLGGHSYVIISVSIPIQHESPQRDPLRGIFMPVLWENLTDPIVTGREELGWSKLYADIPPPIVVGDRYAACALWQGFRFFEMEVSELVETAERPAPAGQFHYKYIPRTGALSEAEIDCLQYSPPGANVAGYASLPVTQRLVGKGGFKFYPARWEDLPFQYPIVNALARLPVLEVRAATLTHMKASGTIGDPDSGALKPVGG